MLRLYVSMVADGSIENKTLMRFHLRKERKIENLEGLLLKLGIRYSKNIQKSGTTKINFTIPDELKHLSIKPLDSFVKKLSNRQVNILLAQYEITDGHRTAKNSVQISTSKQEEAELLQEIFVTSGLRCNLLERKRNNSNHKTSYILSVNTNIGSVISSKPDKEYVENEVFWCIKVKNQNFLCRRNGKVHVTGNCHGGLPEQKGRQMDVGYDNIGEIAKIEDILELVNKKEIYSPDGH